jgi:uncharacterized protein
MKLIFTITALSCAFSLMAQNAKMDFEKYEPKSTLVVPEHKVTKAKFPFIDVHACDGESKWQGI